MANGPKLMIVVGAAVESAQAKLNALKGWISGWSSKLGASSLFGGLTAPLAALTSVAGIAAMTKGLMEQGKAIAENAKELGLSYEAYQRFGKMAKAVGAEEGALETAFRSFSGLITDAIAKPSGEAATKLGLVGVTLEQLQGKSPAQQFETLLKALGSISDPTERMARAVDVFGRSGARFGDLAARYDELSERAKQSSIMTDSAVEASLRFEKSVASLANNIKMSLANSGLIEWLDSAISKFNELAKSAKINDFAKSKGAQISRDSGFFSWLGSFRGGGLWGGKGELGGFNVRMDLTDEEQAGLLKGKLDRDFGLRKTPSEQRAIDEQQADSVRRAAQDKGVDDAIAAIYRKADAQGLVNDGLNKEAILKEKIAELEKAAQKPLRDDQIAKLSKAVDYAVEAERVKQEDEIKARIQDQVLAMQEQIDIQRLILAGKDKEAYIQEKINEAEKANNGRKLDANTMSEIRDEAGQLYDLTHSTRQAPQAMRYTSLEGIGGGYAGLRGASSESAASLTRKSNEILELIKGGVSLANERLRSLAGTGTGKNLAR